MKHTWSARGPALGLYFAAVAIAGCGVASPDVPPASAAVQPNAGTVLSQEITPLCTGFASDFDAIMACQRANGTLEAFHPRIAWRVRYFVRYNEMPCGEFPTVEESYGFHMVVQDLDRDHDLTAIQRITIRNALFTGKAHCP